jgi:cytidylate kinase
MLPTTIAIDGPAASGKSTIAAALAEKLGYLYFDTGVMYRAATWAALDRDVAISDETAVTHLTETLQIDVKPPSQDDGRQYDVLCDGVDVTWAIRSPEVDANVSPVAVYPGVRSALTAQQVVLPEAPLKIYLDASAEERALRRYREVQARGDQSQTYEDILENVKRRDAIDSGRATAPLKAAPDAVILDSTGLSIAEVVTQVEELIARRSA